jgi:hypothetical protein
VRSAKNHQEGKSFFKVLLLLFVVVIIGFMLAASSVIESSFANREGTVNNSLTKTRPSNECDSKDNINCTEEPQTPIRTPTLIPTNCSEEYRFHCNDSTRTQTPPVETTPPPVETTPPPVETTPPPVETTPPPVETTPPPVETTPPPVETTPPPVETTPPPVETTPPPVETTPPPVETTPPPVETAPPPGTTISNQPPLLETPINADPNPATGEPTLPPNATTQVPGYISFIERLGRSIGLDPGWLDRRFNSLISSIQNLGEQLQIDYMSDRSGAALIAGVLLAIGIIGGGIAIVKGIRFVKAKIEG